MKIVYLGSGEFGIECLNSLNASRHTLELVLTHSPHRAGRGRKFKPTAVGRWARENSIPCVETDDVNEPAVVKEISEIKPDLIIVIAFGQKIGNELIHLPKQGALNVHSSLLPKYRGAAPINWAIINGESKTGISIITLSEKMDAGDILAQTETEIAPDETAGELHDKLSQLAPPLLFDTIEKIERKEAVYTPQNESEATLAPKLKKSDGFLDFAEPAKAIRRKILGFWPWPGASAVYHSKKTEKGLKVTIATAEVVESDNENLFPCGSFDEDLNIICGEEALRIKKIKPAGSELMSFKDFVNGRHIETGDSLDTIKK